MSMLLFLLACQTVTADKGVGADVGVDSGAAHDSVADSAGDSGAGDSGGSDSGGVVDTGAALESVPAAPDPSDEIFDVGAVHTLSLEMSASDWLTVRDNPWAKSWVTADMTWTSGRDGHSETVEDVGLRAFGAGSMVAGKPALKISLDRNVPGTVWHGLEQIKLDNSSQDNGYMNEAVATAVLRGMGLPAARTGWARLVVNGEPSGFFVLMEPIDDRFLERWFDNDDGPLYGMISGRWGQGLNPMSDPLYYYENQTSVVGDGSELVEAARLIAEGTDEELAAAVDLDEFTAVSVARSVMGGIDTFSADGNNFYIYVDNGVLRQIAWDMDADLGYPSYFNTALVVDPRVPWATSPWGYNAVTGAAYKDVLLQRHLDMGADPSEIIDALLAGPLDYDDIDAFVVDAATLIRPDVYEDVLTAGTSFDRRIANLRLFLHARLSAMNGGEAADCPAATDGSVTLGSLSPTGTVGWGSLMVDSSSWGPGLVVAGDHYCTGLFAHAPSTVTVTLPAGVSTLTGKVGLHDWNQVCGDGATFSVSQGGVTLWTSGTLSNFSVAEDMGEIAVSAGTLTLSASPNAEYSCDTASWLDVRVK